MAEKDLMARILGAASKKGEEVAAAKKAAQGGADTVVASVVSAPASPDAGQAPKKPDVIVPKRLKRKRRRVGGGQKGQKPPVASPVALAAPDASLSAPVPQPKVEGGVPLAEQAELAQQHAQLAFDTMIKSITYFDAQGRQHVIDRLSPDSYKHFLSGSDSSMAEPISGEEVHKLIKKYGLGISQESAKLISDFRAQEPMVRPVAGGVELGGERGFMGMKDGDVRKFNGTQGLVEVRRKGDKYFLSLDYGGVMTPIDAPLDANVLDIQSRAEKWVPVSESSQSAGEGDKKAEKLPEKWEDIFGHAPQAGDALIVKYPSGKVAMQIHYDAEKGIKAFVLKSGDIVNFEKVKKKLEKGCTYEVVSQRPALEPDVPEGWVVNPEHYNELFEGDKWSKREPNRTETTTIIKFNEDGQVSLSDTYIDKDGSSGLRYYDVHVDRLREDLRKEGYIRATKGTKSEKETSAGSVGKSEEEKMKDFLEIVPNGELICLINKTTGARAYYRSLNDNFIKGQSMGKKKTWATEEAWERYQDTANWELEIDGKIVNRDSSVSVPEAEKETPRTVEQEKEKMVREARTFDELYAVLEQIGSIPNNDGTTATVEEVIRLIEGHREFITEKKATAIGNELEGGIRQIASLSPFLYGIREKEEELLFKEFGIEAKKSETLYLKIESLTKEVDELRAKWVEEDVMRTTSAKKFKSLFGLGKDDKKGEWQVLYEAAGLELQRAEVEMMTGDMAGVGTQLSSRHMREGKEKLLRYYKVDEAVNLIDERTKNGAKNQNYPEKIAGWLGAIGRDYNSIPRWRKYMYAGVFLGLSAATVMSGGVAAAGVMASAVVMRRVAGGLGVAVGTEAGLEQFGAWNRGRKADKEIKEQLGGRGIDAENYRKLLENTILSLDAKLQDEKRAKTLRKLSAFGLGGLVGSGLLAQFAMDKLGGRVVLDFGMDKLGGHTAVEWVKEHANNILGGTTPVTHPDMGGKSGIPPVTEQVPGTPGSGNVSDDAMRRMQPVPPAGETPDVVVPEELEELGTDAPMKPAVEYPIIGAENETPDMISEKLVVPTEPLLDGSVAKFEDILNEPYDVKKGDSIWKILGARVDNLERPQKTYFIDTLKEKLTGLSVEQVKEMGIQSGDINKIAVGDKIDFSKYISQGDVQHAFENAYDLSPEKAASIAANPHVTLTDAVIDNKILHGNTVDAVPDTSGVGAPVTIDVNEIGTDASDTNTADVPRDKETTTIDVEEIGDTSSDSDGASAGENGTSQATSEGVVDESEVFTAKLQPRVDDWSKQILGEESFADRKKLLKTPIIDVFRDFRYGTSVSGLSPEQTSNFAQFMAEVRRTTGNMDLMKNILDANPKTTAEDFLKKVAPLVIQGQNLGEYTPDR